MSEIRKIVKKTTGAKPIVNRNIVKKEVSEEKAKDEKTDIEEAPSPENINVAGWKKKLAEKNVALQPRSLRPKSELWDTMKNEKTEKKTKKEKGFIILVDGLGKVGKSHFALSAVDFKGFTGKRRIIPPGSPVYVLDTENATEDEADFNFPKQVDNGQILIKNCFVENTITKEIDPTKSLELLEEWAYSLTDEKRGTIIIDNFTDYCEWTYYKLVDKILGVGFNQDGVEKKGVAPVQYKWRNKKVKSYLRRLRNIPLNIILIAQVKDEYDNSTGGAFDSKKTGQLKTDAIEKVDYWVDMLARVNKRQNEDGSVTRILEVIESRFETVNMKDREYVIEGDPNYNALIDLIKDLI